MAKILVMDDEAGFRTVIQNVLKPLGHEIFLAEDGNTALEIAAREKPDITFLDIRVPGIDGIGVLSEIMKLGLATKCVMLSGFADAETTGKAMKLGAFEYLNKPFKIDDVLNTVKRALGQPGITAKREIPPPPPAPHILFIIAVTAVLVGILLLFIG